MFQKSISLLMIASFFTQATPGLAQAIHPQHSIPFVVEEENEMNNPLRKSECYSNMAMTGAMSPSEYTELQNLTTEIINSDAGDSDEVKNIYRKNNCNPDAVNSSNTSSNTKDRFGIKGQIQHFKPNDHNKDDFDQACMMDETLTDAEGCQPVRELNHAIKTGKFSAKDYHSAKNSKNSQYSNATYLALGITIVNVAVSMYQAYLSKQSNDLEKQKYEDSKKAAEQANQTCKSNSEPEKTPDTKHETKSETKQETKPEPATVKPTETKDPATQAIQQTSVDTKNIIPDIKDPEHPVVDRDPDSDADWENFSQDVEKQNKICDQKKQAKSKGVSLFEIQNQHLIHSNPKENSSKACNISKLKSDLLLLKSKDSFCLDTNIQCFNKQNAKKYKKAQENKKLKEAYHKCEMSSGGSTVAEKHECNEIQKKIMGNAGSNELDTLEDIINQTKPKSIFEPKPSPTPKHGGGL